MRINLSSFLQRRFNIFIYRKLGWKITLFYIIVLGKLYFFFNRKENQKVKKAIGTVFSEGKSGSEIKSITRNVFRGILFHYYEKLFNAFSSTETLKTFFKLHVQSQGLQVIQNGLAKGNGVLLITGHYGGVEFMPGFLGANNYPITIVVRFSSSQLRQMSIQKAAEFTTKIIDADHTPNVMKAIFESLRENRIVITQCDEIDEWRPSRHETISFLGKKTHLDRTTNILSKRGSAAIVFGAMHRDQKLHYKFTATSPEEMEKHSQHSGNGSVGAAALKYLERFIYKYPQEWYQWKKFSQIETLPSTSRKGEHASPVPLLDPSFGKAS